MRSLLCASVLLLAGLIPSLRIWFATSTERRTLGLVQGPFAWPELLLLHILAALPLACVVAQVLVSSTSVRNRRNVAVITLACGICLVWLFPTILDDIQEEWHRNQTGFAPRVLIRSLATVLLELPWCVLAFLIPRTPSSFRITRLTWVPVLLLAFVVPGLSAQRLLDQQTKMAVEKLNRLRFVQARPLLLGLLDLDPNQIIETQGGKSKPVFQVLPDLDQVIRSLKDGVKPSISSRTPPQERFERARAFLLLDQLTEAEALFAELACNDATSRLMLGEVYLEQGRWEDSEKAYRSGLRDLLPRVEKEPALANVCRIAYDGIVRSFQERRQPQQIEALLQEALRELPTQQAYFTFQLGRHYHDRGRPLDALEKFHEALRLDPKLQDQAQPFLQQIQTTTPGCLFGR